MLQNALLCASLPRTIGSALLASHIRAARSAALTVPGSELVLRADCLNAATSRGWGVPRRASPIGRIFELCRTSQLITTSFNADGLVLLAVFFSPNDAGPNPACRAPDKGKCEFITRNTTDLDQLCAISHIGFSAARARTPQVAMASRSKLRSRAKAAIAIGARNGGAVWCLPAGMGPLVLLTPAFVPPSHKYGHRRAANGDFATGTIRQTHRSGHADDTPR